MATVSMAVRHLLNREGTALADEYLFGWINRFSALLKNLGHSLEIRQEGAGWQKLLPGGELIYAVPEHDPLGPLLPNVSQSVWESAAGISLAIYADPLLVYPQAHVVSVTLGSAIPTLDIFADNRAEPFRKEWLEQVKQGLSTVSCVVANNTQFIQWAMSTWPGLGHKLQYIPDWFEPDCRGNGMGERALPDASSPSRIVFPCPALPRFGISESLRAMEILHRRCEETIFIFCGALTPELELQMRRWFDKQPRFQLLHPDQFVYSEGDIALFPVKSGAVPVQSVLRAMREGAVVIGSMQGPLVDMIIHGHSGLLVRALDRDLLEAVEMLVKESELREKMGNRARQAGAALKEETWVSGWSALLRSLMGGKNDD